MRAPRHSFLLVAAASLLTAAEPATKAQTADPSDDQHLEEFITERIGDWWPTAEEKRFDEIGWAADLREARRLAREHDRPIFLFTMDGRVNTGRC